MCLSNGYLIFQLKIIYIEMGNEEKDVKSKCHALCFLNNINVAFLSHKKSINLTTTFNSLKLLFKQKTSYFISFSFSKNVTFSNCFTLI